VRKQTLIPMSDEQSKILSENTSVVSTIIKRQRWRLPGVDMFEEGLLALSQAMCRFDPSKGTILNFAYKVLRNHFCKQIRKQKSSPLPSQFPIIGFADAGDAVVYEPYCATERPEKPAMESELIGHVISAAGTERNKAIMKDLIFGATLKAAGEKWGLTKQRVEQIRDGIFKRIGNESRLRHWV
jgi:RNA polymerase sigma factor (sigma-70 family)